MYEIKTVCGTNTCGVGGTNCRVLIGGQLKRVYCKMEDLFDVFDESKTLSMEELSKTKTNKRNIDTVTNAEDEVSNIPEKSDESVVVLKNTIDRKGKHAGTGTLEKNLISFSVLPKGYIEDNDFVPPKELAKTFPFVLDPFQKAAVEYIQKGESVLVSAHTSAGKTAVAEYAIAQSLKNKERVIYTSPIKALSNQKYRDLQEEFNDVGLMTGDITINPKATCLIMTTEILRSMLYRGSEVMREVKWVIYDEIHYMRDKERGVVWEESIILLPQKVRFVFLSATIPNSKEFAQWICKIKKQPCHVVYTDYRPTPLQHYLFPTGGDGLHLVVDEKGTFRQDNFEKAMATLAAATNSDPLDSGKKKKGAKKSTKKVGSDVFRIVKLIMERKYDPVIIFSFSKRECEAYALLLSKLDFNTEEEKKMIERVFINAMDSLSDDDKKLPQVDSVLPLLKRGIGIHHGGLLPILKEVIEIMFGEGLIKCLFATETFSMGLNMPAKTVVFTQCRKYDGKEFRWITSGEYIQMSGRAGRRSKDARGIVIQMMSEEMEPQVAKDILYGQADALHSTFHLKYNMLLNLLRVEDADPEYMIRQSFHQFQNEQIGPGLEQGLQTARDDFAAITIPEEATVAEYYHISKRLKVLKSATQSILNRPSNCMPFLNPGRLVRIEDSNETKWDWGVLINFQKTNAKSEISDSDVPELKGELILHVLLRCKKIEGSSKSKNSLPEPPASASDPFEMKICPVPATLLESLSVVRIYVPKDLRNAQSREAIGKNIKEVHRRFPDGLPVLDPLTDMQIDDKDLESNLGEIEKLQKKLVEHPFHSAKDRTSRFALYHDKLEAESHIKHFEREIQLTKSLVLRDDLRRRKRILRKLAFSNANNLIETKGRIACEISIADELVLTEMIFGGIFNDINVHQTVGLVSMLVNETKPTEETGVPMPSDESLHAPIRKVQEIARQIGKICHEANLSIDIEEYVNSFHPGYADVMIAWCQGAKFAHICKMAGTYEGTVIRLIRREEELLRQLSSASHAIGNLELEEKFKQGGALIKRDIAFAASLYL